MSSVIAIKSDDRSVWLDAQIDDPQVSKRRNMVERGCHLPGYTFSTDNILCYYGNIVVPEAKVEQIVRMYHESGHFSVKKIRESILNAGYWFPCMRKRIYDFTDGCKVCARKPGSGYRPRRMELPSTPEVLPFEMISVDITGLLPVQRGGYR